MKVTRESIFDGRTYTMEIDITPEQLAQVEARGSRLIQHVVPHLPPEQREFLLTGATPDAWDKMFPEDEDEAG